MNKIKLLTFNVKLRNFYNYGIHSISRYVYIFFLLSIFFSINGIALADNNTLDNVETLARDALEQAVATQDEVRHLKYKLENVLGSGEEVEKARIETAKNLNSKATEFSNRNLYNEAIIYYKLAFQNYPTIDYLKDYTSAVSKLANKLQEGGSYNDSMAVLSEAKNFILTNIYLINIKDIDKAIAELKIVEDKKNDINKKREQKVKLEDDISLKASIEEAGILLKNNIPNTVDERIKLLKKHEVIVTTIIKLSIDNITDEITSILKKLSESISAIQYSIEIDKLLNRGYELLKAVNGNRSSPFIQQLLSESALIGQRLTILQSTATVKQNESINTFFKEYLKTSQTIADINSSKEYDRLKGKLDVLKVTLFKNSTKAKDAIELLLKLQDEIIVESSNIQDKNYLIKARELIADLNNELSSWQDLQINRYERWATDNIRKFHEIYKDEMGVLGSSRAVKHKIYLGLQDYLCQIDTRYLTPSGSRIYSEVFDYYYKELDRDQRLTLSKEFMNCSKKKLDEF